MQPSHRRIGRQAARVGYCLVLLASLPLAGCGAGEGVERFYDSKLSLDNPVDWWHQLQGGPIADERPPPPGITDPYPNLAQVPARPTPTDPATRQGLLAQLASQRDLTRQLAAEEPLVWPAPGAQPVPGGPPLPAVAPARAGTKRAATAASTPTSAPTQVAVPAAAAPAAADSDESKMVLEAADAPAAATPSAPAAPTTDAHPPAAFTTPVRPNEAVVSGPIPALPGDAPPLPKLAGLPIGTPVPVIARARPAAQFSFPAGSAALPDSAEASLRALARLRTTARVSVSAGGDGRSASPDAQQAALPLAVKRTGAIVAVLVAAGVPSSAIHAQAVAPGRDGSARLIE